MCRPPCRLRGYPESWKTVGRLSGSHLRSQRLLADGTQSVPATFLAVRSPFVFSNLVKWDGNPWSLTVKRTVIYCLISGILGGLLAVALLRGPSIEPRSAAQELGAERGAPFGGPALAVPAPPANPLAAPPADPRAVPPIGAAVATPNPPETGEYTSEERINIWVYEQANRAVVNITTKGYQGERFLLMELQSEGEGSGVVIDRQGHILTNFHVVDGARQIQATLFDGNTYDARLVGQDPATDVAVLKIDAPPASLFPAVFGNSTVLKVGQRVFQTDTTRQHRCTTSGFTLRSVRRLSSSTQRP